MRLLQAIDRFGAAAVLGRMIGVKEANAMLMAERVFAAAVAQRSSEDWAAWERGNPAAARLLHAAIQTAKDLGWIDEYGDRK